MLRSALLRADLCGLTQDPLVDVSTEPPHDYTALFERERESLITFLEGLDEASWNAATPCPGWSFLDLVLHLVGDDFSILARHRDSHIAFAPPPTGAEADFVAWLDELQQTWVAAARRLSPRLAVELLAWSGPKLVALFGSQNPSAVDAQVSWASKEPVPRWLDHAREVSEYWIHRQQLREAIGLVSDLAQPTFDALLDAFRWAYPFRLGTLGALGDEVVVAFTGEADATWCLKRYDPGWVFTTASSQPAATMEATAEDGWRLLTNNLRDAERVTTSGDATLVAALRNTRAIIGTPK
jgi:uncharacterized protein (TIGR03083 family)